MADLMNIVSGLGAGIVKGVGAASDFQANEQAGKLRERQVDLQERSMALQEQSQGIQNELTAENIQRVRNLRIQEAKDRAMRDKPIAVETLITGIPEEYRDYMVNYAKTYGYIDENNMTTVGGLRDLEKRMADSPILQGELSKQAITFHRQKIAQIDQAMPGVKNAKEREALLAQREQSSTALNQAAGTYKDWNTQLTAASKFFTPQSWQKYMETGDAKYLVRVQTPQGEGKDTRTTAEKNYDRAKKEGSFTGSFTDYMDKYHSGTQPKPKDLDKEFEATSKRIMELENSKFKISSGGMSEMGMMLKGMLKEQGIDVGEEKKADSTEIIGKINKEIARLRAKLSSMSNGSVGGAQEEVPSNDVSSEQSAANGPATFKTADEAAAAIKSGKLNKGDKFYIDGKKYYVK